MSGCKVQILGCWDYGSFRCVGGFVGKVEYLSSLWDCDSAPFEDFSLTWSFVDFFTWIAGIIKFCFKV